MNKNDELEQYDVDAAMNSNWNLAITLNKKIE